MAATHVIRWGTVAAVVTALYLAVVVGLGALFGGGAEPRVEVALPATALVALTLPPVSARASRFADRIVYGGRPAPREALARFAERTFDSGEVMARMAAVVAEATGAARVAVWLRVGDSIVAAASWPVGAKPDEVALSREELPLLEGFDRTIAIRHQGDLLGALAVANRPGEPISATEDRLLSDLSAQAGLVLRNARLNEELASSLEEISAQAESLRASRARIAAAHDEERRRLERNIHDGAQQHLVALVVNLGLARTMLQTDRDRARTLVSGMQGALEDTVAALRDLAGRTYPAALTERGVVAALESHVVRSGTPILIESVGVVRYQPEVEAAAYFCCLEAIQNATKHAPGAKVRIRIAQDDQVLVLSVSDDGPGFDARSVTKGVGLQSMSDRLEVLGGNLDVRSATGAGTTVTGHIPLAHSDVMT